MIAENYRQINEILRQLLDSDVSRRGEILENADVPAEIRREVETLLAMEEEIEDFMSLPITDFSKDIIGEDATAEHESLNGKKIGDYEIIGELGAGGMGAVYLAQRVDGKFEQTVALKMLRREYNVERIRRYFKRESKIQAKLEHPNIARLLDVGTTQDGVPFFVMEYVEGAPVDKFCREKNLPLKERLKIFNRICEAAAHAHRNLIVHRDLKPSNILIDASGEPKLLDFGIAKILDEEDAGNGSQTLTLLGAMTPEYASPEQIRGETISTASDIYSLGVILFKILTGAFPFDFANKTNGNLIKKITDSEPILASLAAINSSSEGKISAAELKGDLDNIILKALSKEPARRYDTVEQFSADIWRFVDGLPVSARPATFGYRASKYLQRNKFAVASAALIFLSLIGGTAVALWQAREARAQANLASEAQAEAEQQFALAKAEEEKSKKISRFMFKVFSYADPAWYAEGNKTGGQARVLDALDELSGKIETEFPEDVDIQAELHHKFGEVFSRVSTYNTEPARRSEMKGKSTFHACRALDLRRRFYGDWHELVAKDMYYGAGCDGKTEAEQAPVWNKAIEIFRGTNPNNLNLPHLLSEYAGRLAMPQNAELHDAYISAVNPPTVENKYEIAERYYREALPIFRQHYKPDNLAVFITECDLSYVLAVQDKWTDFDEHFAVCKQGEPVIKKQSTVDGETTSLDLVRRLLAEKGVVR